MDQFKDQLEPEQIEWLKSINAVDISKYQIMTFPTWHMYSVEYLKETPLSVLQAHYNNEHRKERSREVREIMDEKKVREIDKKILEILLPIVLSIITTILIIELIAVRRGL